MTLNIKSNRSYRNYSKKVIVLRVLWLLVGIPLFRCSWRTAFTWRSFILRVFGARIGSDFNIYSSAIIYFPWNFEVGSECSVGEDALVYNLGRVRLGNQTTISHRAHICAGTHDYTKVDLPLLKPEIHIGDQVWVCTDAFVGPGVTIGEGAIVGARAVVTKDVQPWDIVAGNPAKVIKKREIIG